MDDCDQWWYEQDLAMQYAEMQAQQLFVIFLMLLVETKNEAF